MPGMRIQFVLPPSDSASGVKIINWRPRAPMRSGHASRLYSATGSRDAANMSGSPMRANLAWSRNTAYGVPCTRIEEMVEEESTITRPSSRSRSVTPPTR